MIKADVRQQISIYWQLKFIFKQMAPALLSWGGTFDCNSLHPMHT